MQALRLSAALACLALTAAAQAAVVSPTKSNGDFIPGTGISSSDFTVASAPYAALAGPTTVEVGLKAHGRFGLYPVTSTGNVYHATTGTSSGGAAQWNFAFQVSPGENGAQIDGLQAFIDVDFDPAFGATDYVTWGGTIPTATSFLAAGQVHANPGGGAWSSNGVDFVVAGSENMGFSYWNSIFGKTFNPNAIGEYQINLTVKTPAGATLASSTIYVVTPEPASIATLGLAGLMLRRRR